MAKNLTCMILIMVLTCLSAPISHAAAPFYEGKTIKLIIGFSAGGGFDTYSEEIEKIVLQLFKIEPTLISQLKEILK